MFFTNKFFKKFFSIFLCIFFLNYSLTAFSVEIEDLEILNLEEIENLVYESSADASQEPTLNAKNAIVLERSSNRILFGKSEYEKTPMASTTKIATAIVVIEKESNLNKLVTVSKKAASIRGSRLGLSENDKITIKDLLYGLLLCSGNDAAICLAESISGSVENFAYDMNSLANKLNLKNTNFTCPHGLDDENHFTSAYDLAILTNYALNNSTFKQIVGTKNITVYINSSPKNISNTNELLGYTEGVYGVKTGFTNNAGRCLVSSTRRGNLDIITIVLGCDSKKFRTSDSLKLINYIYSNFEMYDLSSLLSNEFDTFLENDSKNISIEKSYSIPSFYLDTTTLILPLKKEEFKNLVFKTTSQNSLSASTPSNLPIGNISIFINNDIIADVSIFLENRILPKTHLDFLFDFFKNFREIYFLEFKNFI